MTDDGRAKQTQQQNVTGFNYKLRVTPLWSTRQYKLWVTECKNARSGWVVVDNRKAQQNPQGRVVDRSPSLLAGGLGHGHDSLVE